MKSGHAVAKVEFKRQELDTHVIIPYDSTNLHVFYKKLHYARVKC